MTFDLPTVGVRDLNSYAYLLSARSRPKDSRRHLRNPGSTDYRNLGVLMRFTAVPAARMTSASGRLAGRRRSEFVVVARQRAADGAR